MKNLLNNNNQNNATNNFAKFQNVAVTKKAQNRVKGGEDIIIEEVIEI